MRLKVLGTSVAIIFYSLLSSSQSFSQENCILRKDSEGVKVSLCQNGESNFKTIIVDLDVPATLAQYAALVLNIDNYFTWQYKVSEQKVLKQISKNELFYYSKVETPWPASNRDFIFHLKLEQEPNAKTLHMYLTAEPDYLPKKEGIVRVPFANSHLTVTPINAENVHVNYVLDIDPGGEVPAWIINMFAANAPWQTYVNFRNQIIDQGNNRTEVDFIKNFTR